MHRHLSLVFLLTPLAVAQAYSGGDDLLDATITKSVTETVTKYLSECGIAPTPFDGPNATFPGTTTVTSTLQSTISVVVSSNLTDVSGVAPTGLGPSQSDVVYSLTSTHTSSVTGIDGCSGFNCSTSPVQNGTTKIPCSTATGINLVLTFLLYYVFNFNSRRVYLMLHGSYRPGLRQHEHAIVVNHSRCTLHHPSIRHVLGGSNKCVPQSDTGERIGQIGGQRGCAEFSRSSGYSRRDECWLLVRAKTTSRCEVDWALAP